MHLCLPLPKPDTGDNSLIRVPPKGTWCKDPEKQLQFFVGFRIMAKLGKTRILVGNVAVSAACG